MGEEHEDHRPEKTHFKESHGENPHTNASNLIGCQTLILRR